MEWDFLPAIGLVIIIVVPISILIYKWVFKKHNEDFFAFHGGDFDPPEVAGKDWMRNQEKKYRKKLIETNQMSPYTKPPKIYSDNPYDFYDPNSIP